MLTRKFCCVRLTLINVLNILTEDSKVSLKAIKAYCQRMQEDNIQRAIIVVQSAMTPSARSALDDLAPKYILEQFMEQELLVNITEHQVLLELLSFMYLKISFNT